MSRTPLSSGNNTTEQYSRSHRSTNFHIPTCAFPISPAKRHIDLQPYPCRPSLLVIYLHHIHIILHPNHLIQYLPICKYHIPPTHQHLIVHHSIIPMTLQPMIFAFMNVLAVADILMRKTSVARSGTGTLRHLGTEIGTIWTFLRLVPTLLENTAPPFNRWTYRHHPWPKNTLGDHNSIQIQ